MWLFILEQVLNSTLCLIALSQLSALSTSGERKEAKSLRGDASLQLIRVGWVLNSTLYLIAPCAYSTLLCLKVLY